MQIRFKHIKTFCRIFVANKEHTFQLDYNLNANGAFTGKCVLVFKKVYLVFGSVYLILFFMFRKVCLVFKQVHLIFVFEV